MVFAPVAPEIKDKIISIYLASNGKKSRSKIGHELSEQGLKVSHQSISNIINRYRRQQEQEQQKSKSTNTTISLNNVDSPSFNSDTTTSGDGLVPNSQTLAEAVFTSEPEQEIDFDDQPSDDFLDNIDYNEALDGQSGELLLGYVKQEGGNIPAIPKTGYIPSRPDTNHVVKEAVTVKEKSKESQHKPALRSVENQRDLGPNLEMDWDATHESRFAKLIFADRKNRQLELNKIETAWKQIEEERSKLVQEKNIFQQDKSNFEQEKIGFQTQVSVVKELVAIAAEIKLMGFEFSTANAWLTSVKNMSQQRGIDMRSAAWKLAEDLKNWQELNGFEIAISNAKHQLENYNIAAEDKKQEIALAVDLRKLGLGMNDIRNLIESNNGHVENRHVKRFEFPVEGNA